MDANVANIDDLVRQVAEAEEVVRNACSARNRAQENAYVAERHLHDLKLRLFKARSVSESQTDHRQLLNG